MGYTMATIIIGASINYWRIIVEQLLEKNLETYICLAVFTGLISLLAITGLFKNTIKIENKKIKYSLRMTITLAIVILWSYFYIYVNLYPVSLAYYEYINESTEEKTGIIRNIEQESKDRINIVIDNTEYTMVHSNQNKPFNSNNIKKGDKVQIQFGKKSKYIFSIYESLSQH